MVQYNTLPREKYFEMSEAIQYVKGMLISKQAAQGGTTQEQA